MKLGKVKILKKYFFRLFLFFSSSLDPETAERIIGFLKKICIDDNITAILSLHQVELARKFADRIVGISTGRISFDEHPEEVKQIFSRFLKSGPSTKASTDATLLGL